MPKAALSPVHRMTTMFLDLDGGEMETVIDIFKAIHRRRTESIRPKVQPVKAAPVAKPSVKAKAKAPAAAPAEAVQ